MESIHRSLFFLCIARQWAQTLQPLVKQSFKRKAVTGEAGGAWVHVHPFVPASLGMLSGSRPPEGCCFMLTGWIPSGHHVRYRFSWLLKYPPAPLTLLLWCEKQTKRDWDGAYKHHTHAPLISRNKHLHIDAEFVSTRAYKGLDTMASIKNWFAFQSIYNLCSTN